MLPSLQLLMMMMTGLASPSMQSRPFNRAMLQSTPQHPKWDLIRAKIIENLDEQVHSPEISHPLGVAIGGARPLHLMKR